MNVSRYLKNVPLLIKRNSSSVLTGIGIVGSIGAIVLAVKATPTAIRRLDRAYEKKNDFLYNLDRANFKGEVPLTPWEVTKTVWQGYIPAVGVELVSVACIIGAQSINLRQQATLITAFGIADAGFKEYQERMAIEAPTKDVKVRDSIARDVVAANPASDKEIVIVGGGDQLFFESMTGRYFNSTVHAVNKAVNDLNYKILSHDGASLSEFHSLLGISTVADGDNRGWTTSNKLEITFSTQITDDERSAIVIGYKNNPLFDYWKNQG